MLKRGPTERHQRAALPRRSAPVEVGARYSEPSTGQRNDFGVQPVAKSILLDLELVPDLKIEPEPLGCAEVLGQPQRGVRRDSPIAVNDLVDPPRGDADVLGDPVLADSHRLEEFLEENFTR